MSIKTAPYGKPEEVHVGSDIDSLIFNGEGLRVRIAQAIEATDVVKGIEVRFQSATAFRLLDELDLARYWSSSYFIRGYHVLEVLESGWSIEENELQGYETNRREWLLVSGNGCVSVFSTDAPDVTKLSWPKNLAP